VRVILDYTDHNAKIGRESYGSLAKKRASVIVASHKSLFAKRYHNLLPRAIFMGQIDNVDTDKEDPTALAEGVEKEGTPAEGTALPGTSEDVIDSVSQHDAPSEEALKEESDSEFAEETEAKSSKEQPKKSGKHSSKESETAQNLVQEREQLFETYKKILTAFDDPGTKLQKTIDFMETTLAQKGTPHFKNFWEARKICLELFKENINPVLRSTLWDKYTELSQEARRLKTILDEQSAFAAEQIEIAIKGLEEDLESLQRELNLLNTYASRVNSLRKELIRTEMRVRHKNRFFQQLSSAGDRVFPRRKELIKQISETYIGDVEAFSKKCQDTEEIQKNIRFFREEIKATQATAKVLTLNTKAFSQTRMRLSKCWDIVKTLEKDYRKERAQQRDESKKNAVEISEKIAALTAEYDNGEFSVKAAHSRISEISDHMHKTQLGRDEVKELRNALAALRKTVSVKENEEKEARQKAERAEAEKANQEKEALKESLTAIHSAAEIVVDQTDKELADAREAVSKLKLSKSEQLIFDQLLDLVEDRLEAARAAEFMTQVSSGARDKEQLQLMAEQWEKRCKMIRKKLDELRHAAGLSGLDFEMAMVHQEAVNSERQRLESANKVLKEIETLLKG
jgi:hypothetical protein